MVFLARDGVQLGTFPSEEVRQGLRSGRFLATDLYLVEGMTEWRPLGEWAHGARAASTPQPARRAGARRPAAALLAGCGALGLLVLLVAGAIGLYYVLRPARPREPFAHSLALFRIGMLHDWEATLHRYADSAAERQFAECSVETWAPVAPKVGWSYWFNTSVFTAVGLDTDHPRTAFYHPWSDTVWLAEWSLAPKPRIVRGWFGAGDVLRAGTPPWNATPLWLRGRGSRADALARALAATIPAAERMLQGGTWPDTAREPARSANVSLSRLPLLSLLLEIEPLRRRVAGEGEGVASLRRELAALSALPPARLATRLRDAPENTAEMRQALSALPAPYASSLQPVCRLGAGDTALVVLMPGRTADVALATVWDVRGSSVRLARVDVLPFAALLQAARRSGGR